MDIIVDFPGGARVDAHFRGHDLKTDQLAQGGGQDSAPMPFELFLASIGTCAGIYVLGFCRQRGIPYDKIKIVQTQEYNPTNQMVEKVYLDIQLPPDFPEKYRDAVIRSAEQCKVKKTLEHPPVFQVTTSTTK
jgi:ribosomal protein S12 methylthiotransferase accessory factor